MIHVCRICLKNDEDQQLENIFATNGPTGLPKLIALLTHIQVLPEDGLPSKICQLCKNKLNDFVKFRDQIENHEYLLKKCLAKSQIETIENVKRLSSNIHGLQLYEKSSNRDLELQEFPSGCSIDPYTISVFNNNLSLPLTRSVTINTVSDAQNLDILEKEVSKLLNYTPETEIQQSVLHIPNDLLVGSTSCDKEIDEQSGYDDINKYLQSTLNIDYCKLKEDIKTLKQTVTVIDPKNVIEKLSSRGVSLVKMEQDITPIPEHPLPENPLPVSDKQGPKILENIPVIMKDKSIEKLVEVTFSNSDNDFITPIETRELFIDEDILEEIVPRICETVTTLIHVNEDVNNQQELCTFNRYICHLCLKEFMECDKDEFEKHSLGHFPSDVIAKTQNCPPFFCEVCDANFLHRIDMIIHQREHFNLKLFSCDTCVKCFISVSHLKFHKTVCLVRNAHSTFTCMHCGLGFSKRRDLDNHEKSHSSKTYKCELCDKTLSNTITLKTHMKRHTSGTTFQCDKCQKSFYSRHDLARHSQHHTGIRKFPCSLCDKSFYSNAERRRHLLYHNKIRRFTCKICDKRFYESGHLQTHVNTHMKNKPFMCEICSKDFITRVKLKRHMLTHEKSSNVTDLTRLLSENVNMISEGVESFIIVEESDDDDSISKDAAENNKSNLQMFTDEAGQMFFILKNDVNDLTLSSV